MWAAAAGRVPGGDVGSHGVRCDGHEAALFLDWVNQEVRHDVHSEGKGV